jgi:alkylation response protein AidB-like acyl-CoA dehydrogenase
MTRFAFSDEQRRLGQTVRELCARVCPPAVVRAAWQGEGRSASLWRALAEVGLVGATVPEAFGGLGLDALDWVLPLEETGRAALPAPLVETTAVGAPLLAELGGELAARWLARVAAGEAILTVALAGQPLVPDAHVADLLLLERAGALYAVERAAIALTPERSVDGARRLFRVVWEPANATRLDASPSTLAAAFDRGALATAAQLCGLSRRMLELTVEHVQTRRQFGQPIGAFQAVKHHLADALLALELARPLVYRAAWSTTRGVAARATHVSMAKANASEAATRVARAALQCHGAIGYSFEHDLHLWMKRAWALAAAWGDAAWHRSRVGAAILDGGET